MLCADCGCSVERGIRITLCGDPQCCCAHLVGSKYSMRRLTCGFSRKRRCGGTRGRHLDEPRPSRLTDGRTHTLAPREAPGQGIERINGPYRILRPAGHFVALAPRPRPPTLDLPTTPIWSTHCRCGHRPP